MGVWGEDFGDVVEFVQDKEDGLSGDEMSRGFTTAQ